MFLGWTIVFLLLTVLPTCKSVEVSIPEKEYEIASGGDVTLTCSFVPARPDLTTFVLTWEAYPDNVGDPLKPVATYFMNNRPDIAPPYEGRATLNVNVNQRASSLLLTKVSIQDSRRYQCSVLIPNDDEGTTAVSTSLLVLVPPSAPICNIQGTAEYFHDISLTCDSKEGSPTPTYDWNTYSVDSVPRPFPPKTIKKDGTLSLFNISKEMSGYFMCKSTNRIGSSSCNLTLAVMPPSSNTAATAGIVVGVIAGVLLLIIVLYCFCRKKGKKDTYEEGSPAEMEFHDQDAPETGKQYADNKSDSDQRQASKNTDNDIVPEDSNTLRRKLDDDQHSFSSNKDSKGGDIDSYRYKDDRNHESRDRGSRDHLNYQHDYNKGSRDRLDDQRDPYRGSRDRLDDQRDHYRGSRDRLDDQHDHYRGSRDRLDDQRDQYRGSRDRLDDQRDQYRGSRDRLDDQRDRYHGSRDRLDRTDEPYRSQYN